jgi:hypothetical protein
MGPGRFLPADAKLGRVRHLYWKSSKSTSNPTDVLPKGCVREQASIPQPAMYKAALIPANSSDVEGPL